MQVTRRRTLDDLWKRMTLLLWERREGLYMSLQKSWSAAEAETRRDERKGEERDRPLAIGPLM